METFFLKPRIRFGTDALSALDCWKGKRALVVTDGFFVTSRLIERVTGRLSPEQVTVFDRVEPDPSLQLVAEGAALLRQKKPEVVIALGGGSAMDCAKAIRYFGSEGEKQVPLLCVPTTAGSGSEATAFAVLTDTEKGVKRPLVDESLLPEEALLDGAFLAGIPAGVTADTGMDVLSHALEAYVARGANPFTAAMSSEAFRMALEALPRAAEGEAEAKGRMLYASCLAGIAFNGAGLGLCHAFSHVLGGRVHMPHGRLNALLLPLVVRWNGEDGQTAEKYAALCHQAGIPGTVRALAARLTRLRGQLKLPDRLPEPVDCLAAAQAALEDRCAGQNPRHMTAEEGALLLREVCP